MPSSDSRSREKAFSIEARTAEDACHPHLGPITMVLAREFTRRRFGLVVGAKALRLVDSPRGASPSLFGLVLLGVGVWIGGRHLGADFPSPGVELFPQGGGLLGKLGRQVPGFAEVGFEVEKLHMAVVVELDEPEVALAAPRCRAWRRLGGSAGNASTGRRGSAARTV